MFEVENKQVSATVFGVIKNTMREHKDNHSATQQRRGLFWVFWAVCFLLSVSSALYVSSTLETKELKEALVDNENWSTYTNTDYGYEISYPETVEFKTLSDAGGRDEAAIKNQIVFIGDSEGRLVFNMSVGALTPGYSAYTIDELQQNFITKAVPKLVNGRVGQEHNLTAEDFIVTKLQHNDQPAIQVLSPASYTIEKHNDKGMVFTVSANDYTGTTSTPKDRLTREIIDTFTVLE